MPRTERSASPETASDEITVDDLTVLPDASGEPTPRSGGAGPAWTTWIEPGLAALLTLVSLVFLGRYLYATRHLSLWTDELFSVLHFGQNGPVAAATDYSSANNHVLVSIVGAATPGNLLSPWRPRLISYVAIVAMTGALIWELARRRHLLMGALVVAALSLNASWIEQSYTARGYGLMAAAVTFWCLAVWRYLDDGRRRWLIVAGAAALVGVWSIPSFVLFVGPAWIVLLLVVRRRDVLVAGVASAAAMVAVYAPVAGELVTAFRTYGDNYVRNYGNPTRPIDTFRAYLFNPSMLHVDAPAWMVGGIMLVVLLGGVAGGWLFRRWTPDLRFGQVLASGTLLFLAICVLLQTPIDRTVAFVLIPFLLVATVLVGAVLARPSIARRRPAIAAVVLVPVLLAAGLRATGTVAPIAVEDWQGDAALVQRVFPTTMPIETSRDPQYLAPYLSPPRPVGLHHDDRRVSVGGAVLVDQYDYAARPDLSRYEPVAELRLIQSAGLYSRVLAVRPTDSGLSSLSVGGVAVDPEAKRDLAGLVPSAPGTLDVVATPKPGAPSRSLVLTLSAGEQPVDLANWLLSADVALADGTTRPVPSREVQHGVDTLAVGLGDRDITSVHVSLLGPPGTGSVVLHGAWRYQPT